MRKKSFPSFPELASWRQIRKRRVPDTFFRGFPNSDCISSEGYVTQEGFKFELPKNEKRADSFEEASINWNDDQHALNLLCRQKSERHSGYQFKYGYSEMRLEDVLISIRPFYNKKHFSYERKPLEKNPYHGNLLIESTLTSQTKRMIRNALACIASMNYHKLPSEIE